MIPGTVTIHVIPPELRSTDAGWPYLSPAERVRAVSFVFPTHASHWIACRAAMRRILGQAIHVPPGEVPIVISELGKPELAEPFDYIHFSISHCDHLALVAVCVDGPVGVDVEPLKRAPELADCEATFCHPDEIASLPAATEARNLRLLDLWTAKEALLKALGTGFTVPPESVSILTTPASADIALPGIEDQAIHRLNHPALAGHNAAVSVPKSVTRIDIRPFDASTPGPAPDIAAVPSTSTDG